MRKLFAACLLPFLVLFLSAQVTVGEAPSSQNAAAKPKIVVHLSHFTDDLHRSFMALKLATLTQKSGAEVYLFLDIEGVRLADQRQSLDVTWGPSEIPLRQHYEAFVNAGGTIALCPHCAHAAGVDEKNLIRGAKIFTEEQLGKMLLETEKIIDY